MADVLIDNAILGNGRTLGGKLGEARSVKDFGATGDGVTDDTAAISTAITTLNGTRACLEFPPGIYLISSQLPNLNYLSLRGLGGDRRGNGPLIQQSHATTPILATTVGAACSITGLRLWGQPGSTSLVTLDGSDTVKYCYLSNCAGAALTLSSTTVGCNVEDVYIINAVKTRSGSTQIGGLSVLGTDHWLERIESSVESGFVGSVSTNKAAVSLLIGGSNHFVSNCIGEFGDVGIVVTATKCRFTACRVDRCMGDGWTVSGSQNSFVGCQAMECGTALANTYDGIICSGVLNVWDTAAVLSQGSAQLRYGIRDTVVSNSQKTIWKTPRVIPTPGTARYSWGASASNMPDFGRTMRAATADLTTIDVSEAAVITLDLYTTPTTVTSFTNGSPGQEVTLLGGAAAVTFANGTNIKTKSGSNVVTTTTSAHKFVAFGGTVFREV